MKRNDRIGWPDAGHSFARHWVAYLGTAMRVVSALALSVFLSLALSASAGDNPVEFLLGSRSLKCTFPTGTVTYWEKGSPRAETVGFGNPLHFDSIDLKAGKARFIGNIGATDVTLVASPQGITFVETTLAGGFMSTTVFAWFSNMTTREPFAVYSRHFPPFGALEPPVISQYRGTCKRWD